MNTPTPETDALLSADLHHMEDDETCPVSAYWRMTDHSQRMERERNAWKANHDNQVAIKRTIAARPDLKERAPMVEKLIAERNRAQAHSLRQQARITELERAIRETLMKNLHLADGEVCTLKLLKDAIGFEMPPERSEPMNASGDARREPPTT